MSIFGLEPRRPIPEGYTPLEAIAVVKCLAEDGTVALTVSVTPGVNAWEAVGMCEAALDVQQSYLRGCWLEEDEGGDEG